MSGPTTTETGVWRAVSASRRGSAHADTVPNQDAVQLRRVSAPTGDVWVVGVADGHGGARYVRSDVGARTAVDVAVHAVCEALAEGAAPASVLRETVPSIVEQWRERVQGDARDRPFTDDELARGPGGGVTAYGSTLLVAIVGEHGVAVAQVGDGDALVRSHGFATRPVPGDDRLVAGETTSMCLDSAADDFRYAVVPASADPDLVLLATDGYGNSFAMADWWHVLVDDVAAFVVRSGFDRVADELPGWLEESARVGGDDVSAVLLVRDPLTDVVGAAPARTRELPGSTEDVPRVVAPPATRRGRRGLVAVLATAAAVLGVVGALFLLGPGRSDEPPVSPEPTTSTPTSPSGSSGGQDGDGGARDKDGGRDKDKSGRDSTPPVPEQKPPDTKGAEQQEPPDDPAKPVPSQE